MAFFSEFAARLRGTWCDEFFVAVGAVAGVLLPAILGLIVAIKSPELPCAVACPGSGILWQNLSLGRAVSAVGDSQAACGVAEDNVNYVFVRGNVTVSPVPSVGGVLLAVFEGRTCDCLPASDVTVASIATVDFGTSATVGTLCVTRIRISRSLPPDVNEDRVIDQRDVELIRNSPYYSVDPEAASKCVASCGRVDVNGDGKVNQLDSTSVTQSALLGTRVDCGGIFAEQFTCGSTQAFPVTSAVGVYLNSFAFPR